MRHPSPSFKVMGRKSRKKKQLKIEASEAPTILREFAPVGDIKLPPHSHEVRAINMALKEMHGVEVAGDRQKYRISWSTLNSEIRFGTYSVFYMGHIFLRDETGYIRVAKYPRHPDKWVLEQLIYYPVKELPETVSGHYELVYAFEDKNKNYLEPLHEVAEVVIWSLNNPQGNIVERLEREDKRKFEREVAYFENYLEDTTGSWIVTALRDKEAVIVPHNYETPSGVIGVTKGVI